MQDIQNIPVPDDDSNDPNAGLGSHSNVREDLDNDDETATEDVGNITETESQPTGFENVPRSDSDRTDIERP